MQRSKWRRCCAGSIVRVKGVPADDAKVKPEAQWVLNGDRGLTYAETLPKGSKIVAGKWWTNDGGSEPQVSFVADLAAEMGLTIGDTITVNILGRNITARITSLREIQWESLAINFVMVFSPNTLQAAPHNLLATVQFPKTTAAAKESTVAREIGRKLPSVSMIRVKDAINVFADVFGKVMIAVRVAASVTLLAGALVLAGALATAQRRRVLQAVVPEVYRGDAAQTAAVAFGRVRPARDVDGRGRAGGRRHCGLAGGDAGSGRSVRVLVDGGGRRAGCVRRADSGIRAVRDLACACRETCARSARALTTTGMMLGQISTMSK